MGLGLSFAEGEGPRFARTAADEASIGALEVPDMDELRYVFDAVATIKRALAGRVPLIGFAGSPFTLACYMIEGGGSTTISRRVRRMAYARPDLLAKLVDVNARAVTAYLDEQIRAGADAVMLFDTWGGLLDAAMPTGAFRSSRCERCCARSRLRRTARALPTIVFTKGGGEWLDGPRACGARRVGLDWTVDLAAARRAHGDRVALQGNLDPLVLSTDAATVAREAERVVRAAGPAPGPHLQPRPRHRAAHAARARRGARRDRAPRLASVARDR